jgi:hypothetical protein
VNDKTALEKAVKTLRGKEGPAFLLIKVIPEEKYETASRVMLSPEEIRNRFMAAAGKPA